MRRGIEIDVHRTSSHFDVSPNTLAASAIKLNLVAAASGRASIVGGLLFADILTASATPRTRTRGWDVPGKIRMLLMICAPS